MCERKFKVLEFSLIGCPDRFQTVCNGVLARQLGMANKRQVKGRQLVRRLTVIC